jgi:hypothetical protein
MGYGKNGAQTPLQKWLVFGLRRITALKERDRLLKRQHVKRDVIGQLTPLGEPRRDEHARPNGWQKVC